MDPRERATAEALAAGQFESFRKVAPTSAKPMDRPFTVETPGGVVDGQAGDYLCLDALGQPYPCAKDVFEATYVKATE